MRCLPAVVVLVVGSGCPATDDPGHHPDAPISTRDGGADAAPTIMYEPFSSATWSLAVVGAASQLSITDASGAPACALSTDHHHNLPGAGAQLILNLPMPGAGTCPQGSYELLASCSSNLGTGAVVPAGCAYYRRWNAQGQVLGTLVALNGLISVSGTASACAIRVNVGFLGGSFAETFTMQNGTATQPWCN